MLDLIGETSPRVPPVAGAGASSTTSLERFSSNFAPRTHPHHHHHHPHPPPPPAKRLRVPSPVESAEKINTAEEQEGRHDGGPFYGLEGSPFDSLTEEIIFLILSRLEANQEDAKSFSLVCKSFYLVESLHRPAIRPLRSDLLAAALARYPCASRLDLTLCLRVSDAGLAAVAGAKLRSSLRSVDLSLSRGFSHAGIESLVLNCAGLVEIDLSNATGLGDAAAAAIGRAPNLERLWLARCKAITDMGIGRVAVGCPKLRLLCLKGCLGITDLGIALIAVKCKQIRTFDLSFTMITKKCLPAVLRLPCLEKLLLVGCLNVEDDSCISIKQECKSLEVLDMSKCQNIGHSGFSSILNKVPNLQCVHLAYNCNITYSLTCNLRNLSKLQRIKLDGCEVTTTGLIAIGNSCISLREVSLSKCLGVTDEGLSSIVTKQKDLVMLDITCCRKITDVSLANISKPCTSLKTLRMESCVLVTKDVFILIGQHCHLLEELDLTDNDIDDEVLKAISRCQRLASLKVGICLTITDEGLRHIGNHCPKLQEIDLYRCVGITDKGVQAIACGCLMLQMINLAYCTRITDDSLKLLSECSNLNTLEIRGCSQVSSAGLTAITVGCRLLTKLDIKKCCRINDAGILLLARFSQNLHQINLSYCAVTDVGLLALASLICLQNMTLLHLDGITANGLGAALLACRGLIKVKLHSSFKSLIPQPIVDYVEARGCIFLWRDKPYQVELDESNEVWKQHLQEMHV